MVVLLKSVFVHDGSEYKEMNLKEVKPFYRLTKGQGLYWHSIPILIDFVSRDFKHNNHPVRFEFYDYYIPMESKDLQFTGYTVTDNGFTLQYDGHDEDRMYKLDDSHVRTFTVSVSPDAKEIAIASTV